MANTAGMSDERLRDLLSTDTTTAAAAQRADIPHRMDLPRNSQPAARVIRRSSRRPNNSRNDPTQTPPTTTNPPFKKKEKAVAPPILKGIIERPREHNNAVAQHDTTTTTSSTTKRPRSKFAMEKKHANGFPSLNQPVGTFANKQKQTKKHNNITSSPSSHPDVDTMQNKQQLPESAAAKREADAMIQGMSPDEIQQQLHELQSAMSPQMIQFLKQRGQQQQTKRIQGQKHSQQQSEKPNLLEKPTENQAPISPPKDEIEEKKRIAQLLSSVKTYEDMDQVYEAEIGETSSSGAKDYPSATNLAEKTELEQAFALLRSSAPRQTLWAAKVVCQNLEDRVRQSPSSFSTEGFRIGSSNRSKWPYPTLLPVSLRCLLDASSSHTNGLELHSYILRSLYALLLLRTPREHCVDVNSTAGNESPQRLFQTHFMLDNIPTPSFGSLYPNVTAKPLMSNPKGETVAYSTSSSSKSASEDGQAFLQDPSWTLLSKMKIVPRLASLLLLKQQPLSEEALIGVCGILAMLSARSPGAAAAIAQHRTLLPSLLERTVLPPTSEETETHFLKPSVSLPVLMLLNTMARQSRTVASSLKFDSVVPPLLAIDSTDFLPVHVEGLLLWRTLLRYGLGITHLSSFVALSIRHSGNSVDSKLAPFYLSCFAAALDCIKINTDQIKLSNDDEKEVLKSTLEWLLPTAKECARFIASLDGDVTGTSSRRHLSACLGLLASYGNASCHVQTRNGEYATDSWRALVTETSLDSHIKSLIESKILSSTLSKVPLVGCSKDLVGEALACSFVDNLVALVSVMQKYSKEAEERTAEMEEVDQTIVGSFVDWINEDLTEGNGAENTAQLAWLNQCHFAVAKFFMANTGRISGAQNWVRVRSFGFHLIGRLGLGDEAKAAILFSNDTLFHGVGDGTKTSSPLSSMLMQETCSTQEARAQLDHSFKLQRGFGITSDGNGPFGTNSMLSEAEKAPASASSSSPLLLPLGNAWLWQILSGSIKSGDGNLEDALALQVQDVLSSCLELLLELQLDRKSVGGFDSVPAASKVYYLINICLYPEAISGDDRIGTLTSRLLHLVVKECQEDDAAFGNDFISTSFGHSRAAPMKSSGNDKADARDENMLAVMSGTPDASSRAVRATTDFLADFCSAFVEFGVQYQVFSDVVTCFLRPVFPSRLQCEVLSRLRDMLHLLVVDSEESDEARLKEAVALCVRSGAPDGKECLRDAGELLDLVCDILRRDQGGERSFFRLYSIVLIARNLTAAIVSQVGIGTFQRRLAACPPAAVDKILRTTSALLEVGKDSISSMDLVEVACHEANKEVSDEDVASFEGWALRYQQD